MIDNDRGQTLVNKYVWVIETIYRRRKISFRELNDLWLRDDISRGVEISKRTFDHWKGAILDMFGIVIENEKRGEYRYYIANREDINKNGLRSWLYKTFCVSNALANFVNCSFLIVHCKWFSFINKSEEEPPYSGKDRKRHVAFHAFRVSF